MTIYYCGIGSRTTPKDVCQEMTYIAMKLADAGFILRSGGADGADTAFENGAGNLKEIYLPWDGFNNRKIDDKYFFDFLPAAKGIAATYHPNWNSCKIAAKKLHSRNVHQILGKDLITPSKFVICWTNDGKISGGTGQAMRIANDRRIPIYNLKNMSAKDVAKAIFLQLKEETNEVA